MNWASPGCLGDYIRFKKYYEKPMQVRTEDILFKLTAREPSVSSEALRVFADADWSISRRFTEGSPLGETSPSDCMPTAVGTYDSQPWHRTHLCSLAACARHVLCSNNQTFGPITAER